jgi:hypothetical protein
MFDLDREVANWSAKVHAERCQPAAGVAELTDHLYCEIDRGRVAGLSDEEAFRAATARLGAAPELTAEHAKNRSALGTVCRVAGRLDGSWTNSEDRRALLAHGMIWASLMIGFSIVMSKAAPAAVSLSLLFGIILPLWLASEQLLRRALRHRRG